MRYKRGREGTNDTSSPRPKRLKSSDVEKDVSKYFKEPTYKWMTRKAAGGKLSKAILSPNSLIERGTDADPKKPFGITKAREKYPECYFKAGHLLNADFGGDGKKAKNLTILTAQANTKMQSFDNNIKKALKELKKLYQCFCIPGVDIKELKYGIEIEIEVSQKNWGVCIPDQYITQEVICKAELWGETSLTNLLEKTENDSATQDAIRNKKSEIEKSNSKIKELVGEANRNGKIANSKPNILNTGSTKIRKNTGSTKIRKNTGSTKIRKNTGSTKIRKNTGSTKIRKNTGSTKIRKNTGSTKIRKNTGSTKIRKNKKRTR